MIDFGLARKFVDDQGNVTSKARRQPRRLHALLLT